MKKELPRVFQNKITKPINNNSNVFHGESRSINATTVDNLFKPNMVYRKDVMLTLKDRTIQKKIIGRTENNLITFDNEIIPVSDIIKIEEL